MRHGTLPYEMSQKKPHAQISVRAVLDPAGQCNDLVEFERFMGAGYLR
jgi:hypothetical protein